MAEVSDRPARAPPGASTVGLQGEPPPAVVADGSTASAPGAGDSSEDGHPLRVDPGGPSLRGITSSQPPLPTRVLVVDDDAPLAAIVGLALANEGIDVRTEQTAAACLNALDDPGTDLVLLEVVLPDMSGWEVLRRIRERSDVPVMLLTGRDSDVDKARGLDLGADDYLTKPFSFMELEARVRALLRRARAGSAAPREHLAVRLDTGIRSNGR
jgi:two-component system, OmpR family, response regulator